LKPARACLAVFLLFVVAPTTSALARNVYVANAGASSVSVIDTATNRASQEIGVGREPFAIAITPDGSRAYVTNFEDNNVSVINTATNQPVGNPIPVGENPEGIAITPDGSRAYVANDSSESVSVIDTATNTASPTTINVGREPAGIAITPDGKIGYVTNFEDNNVSVINLATNQPLGNPIPVGTGPFAIAITPDGSRAYVANARAKSVSVINLATNQPLSSAIPVGENPGAIAISPDGKFAYVTSDAQLGSISVINTATNQPVGNPIPVGQGPEDIAITPDGSRAYVTNRGDKSVSVINTATNQPLGSAIPVNNPPAGIAIVPDQAPLASFAIPTLGVRPDVPVSLDASASKDPDGAIAAFAWSFGDGQSASLTTPTALHSYASPGTYSATLTLTDNEGCSVSRIFTGQTVSCNGSSLATATATVNVAFPGVKVRCPKSAKPKGCSFKLQVVAKKPKKGKKAKPESAVAKAKVKAGDAAIVSLKPTKAFRAKLAAAKQVLVKETVSANGTTRTRVAKLKIVQ
jgi:YVTN family beta-propeller protein